MPSTATHAFLAEDLYNKLNKNIKDKISKKRLMTFAQNTDPLLFYNILSLRKGKQIRNLQHKAHSSNINNYFYNLITYIKKNKLYIDSDVLAYLYGFISHYSLDGLAHPYIYYKTGHFIKNDKNTYKYNCLHHHMEVLIDNTLIYERKTKKYKRFNITKYAFDLKPFSKNLNEVLRYSYNKTFNVKNMDKIYYKSLKDMNNFFYLFRRDKYGIKKFFYKFFDKITPKSAFVLESLSYNHSIEDSNNYLNKNNKKWNYSVDKNITSNKSFYDIYNTAIEEAEHIINEVHSYFFNNKKINIEKLFNNRDYSKGINCDSKLDHKYFEF